MRWATGLLRICLLSLVMGLVACGCHSFMKQFSDRLTHWNMLGEDALDDPIKAVGGSGMVFEPKEAGKPLSRKQLAAAKPETLVAYYSPIFVQQRANGKQQHPYPPEYDLIGEAHLKHGQGGKLKSYVAGSAKVYAIFKKLPIESHEHVQITYTAWYPAHPKMKAFDVEVSAAV